MEFFGAHIKVQKFKYDEDIENIRKDVQSQGTLYNDDRYEKRFLGIDRQWARPTEYMDKPKFIDGKPNRFDALQGDLGDCWLVSAIEAISMNDQLIKFVVPPDQSFDKNSYVGAFHFRLWKFGTWYDVVVDDYLPFNTKAGKLLFCHSRSGNVMWAALLEKAYVKFAAVNGLPDYYANQLKLPSVGMQDLSGGLIEHGDIKYPPSEDFKNKINSMFWRKDMIVISTIIDSRRVKIKPAHSYLITSVFRTPKDDPKYPDYCLVRLMNPEADMEWKGDWNEDDYNRWKQIDSDIRKRLGVVSREDGEFWMSAEDLAGWFTYSTVCYICPRDCAEIHTGNVSILLDMQTVVIHGEWVENVSAYGSDLDERYKNPQFAFTFESPDYDPLKDKFAVVIELLHKKKDENPTEEAIQVAFYIYPIKSSTPLPLNLEYMIDYEPIESKPDFDKSAGRAFLGVYEVEPGDYCIIPCTKRKYMCSQFLLRIFSGGRILNHYLDNFISKTKPTDEENPIGPHKEIGKLFNDVVEGDVELNWKSLREILNVMMNSNGHYFGVIPSFIIRNSLMQYIRRVFRKYLPIWSFGDDETDEIRFTKDECRSMIAMFDDDHSGKLSCYEFTHLWKKISFWTKVYEQFQNDEGYLKTAQLRDALSTTGYEVNKRSLHSLSYLYATDQGNIVLTDFILCAVNIETAITLWQKGDVKDVNYAKFTLKEWVKSTLNL